MGFRAGFRKLISGVRVISHRIGGRLKAMRAGWGFHLRAHFPAYVVSILLFLFFLLYFWPRIFITVNAGESAVLYRRFLGGTVVDRLYGEGFHVIFPWDIMTVYNVRYQVVPHTLDVLSNK